MKPLRLHILTVLGAGLLSTAVLSGEDENEKTKVSLFTVERRAAKVYTGTILGLGKSDRSFCVVPIFFANKNVKHDVSLDLAALERVFEVEDKEAVEGPFIVIKTMVAIGIGAESWYIAFLDEHSERFQIFKADRIGEGVFTQASQDRISFDLDLRKAFNEAEVVGPDAGHPPE